MKPHAPDRYAHVDQSKLRQRSNLPPGYSGHVPVTKADSTASFGTSKWRTNAPVSRAQAAAIAAERAKQRAMDDCGGYVHPDDQRAGEFDSQAA